jgi:hypothetical protein
MAALLLFHRRTRFTFLAHSGNQCTITTKHFHAATLLFPSLLCTKKTTNDGRWSGRVGIIANSFSRVYINFNKIAGPSLVAKQPNPEEQQTEKLLDFSEKIYT